MWPWLALLCLPFMWTLLCSVGRAACPQGKSVCPWNDLLVLCVWISVPLGVFLLNQQIAYNFFVLSFLKRNWNFIQLLIFDTLERWGFPMCPSAFLFKKCFLSLKVDHWLIFFQSSEHTCTFSYLSHPENWVDDLCHPAVFLIELFCFISQARPSFSTSSFCLLTLTFFQSPGLWLIPGSFSPSCPLSKFFF